MSTNPPSIPSQVRHEYNTLAPQYDPSHLQTTAGVLERQLVKLALPATLSGQSVLDLGGGTGIHARTAIDLGAAVVDLVDISPGMMQVAADVEKALGREGVMRFFEGDVAGEMGHLSLRKGRGEYDVVMANWVFDHAESEAALEGMLGNVVGYLKQGGVFVGVRVGNPWSKNVTGGGPYGVAFKRHERIPGGVKYAVVIGGEPPIELEAQSFEATYSGSREVYERAGLAEIETVPFEKAELVQERPEYWKDLLGDPFFAVVKAVKK